MRLYLKNVGMIKEADVRLDGLTVIAGENDTGKSTVGKVIFSILKGIQKYEENLEDKFKKEIFPLIDEFYNKFSKKTINHNIKQNVIIALFPPIFIQNLLQNKNDLNNFFKKYKRIVSFDKNLEHEFELLIKRMKHILLEKDKKNLQEEAIKRAFFSEFRNQVAFNNQEGLIEIFENKNKVISIKAGREIKLRKNNEFSLEDVTLIETPMILNFSDMIQRARSHFEEDDLNKNLIRLEADVIYHSKDLINKLINASKYPEKEIDKELSKILKYDFEYERDKTEFVYLKNGIKYYSINVADGIKSFGIIKLLLKGNYIRKNTLLIIDEPEVHLHPKWQIEYAKILVELVKREVKVLVTSHSPYMIEALKKYSDFFSLNNKTSFYLSEDNNIYQFKNSNSLTLEKIFYKLSEPFDNLDELEENEKNV